MNDGRIIFQGTYVSAPSASPVSAIISVHDGRWQPIAKVGDVINDTSNAISQINDGFVVTESGYLTFRGIRTDANQDDAVSIFRASADELLEIARVGDSIPGSSDTIHALDMPSINGTGSVVFSARIEPFVPGPLAIPADNILLRSDGGALSIVAQRDQFATDDDFRFSRDPNPSFLRDSTTFSTNIGLSETGQISFWSDLCRHRITPLGDGFLLERCRDGFSEAIFLRGGDANHLLVRRSTPAPDGNGSFRSLRHGLINENGIVTFHAELSGTAGGFDDDVGIYTGSLSGLNKVVRDGDLSPDGNGTVDLLTNSIWMNTSGDVVFLSTLRDTADAPRDIYGLYAWRDGNLLPYARSGMESPHTGRLSGFMRNFLINEPGQVVFETNVIDESDRLRSALFLADDRELVEIIRIGDPLEGSEVTDITPMFWSTYSRTTAINDHSQQVFAAELADGREAVFLHTPSLNWNGPTDGIWESTDNWRFRIQPGPMYRVGIHRTGNLVLLGPEIDTSVKSLSLGGKNCDACVLSLQPSGLLNAAEYIVLENGGVLNMNHGSIASEELTILDGGKLTGTGSVNASIVRNDGIIALLGDSAGTIDIHGDYSASETAGLHVGFRETSTGNVQGLEILGNAALAGQLMVQLPQDYQPEPGDRFDIIRAEMVSGTFDETALPGLNEGLTWNLEYRPSGVSLLVATSNANEGGNDNQTGSNDAGNSSGGSDGGSGGGGTMNFWEIALLSLLTACTALQRSARQHRKGTTPMSGSSG